MVEMQFSWQTGLYSIYKNGRLIEGRLSYKTALALYNVLTRKRR